MPLAAPQKHTAHLLVENLDSPKPKFKKKKTNKKKQPLVNMQPSSLGFLEPPSQTGQLWNISGQVL